MDHLLEGCQIIGFDWQYLYLNKAVIAQSRKTREELIGNRIMGVYPGIEETELFALMKDCLENRTSHLLENKFTFPDDSIGWFELRIEPVPEGLFILSLDITERKNTEEENKTLQAQLSQAQKMESIGRLAGGVAHDFNNMLNVILGYTDIALECVANEDPLFHDLSEIKNAADRAADLTRQLLAFARKQIVTPKVLDLNETVEGMLKILRRIIGENIDLKWVPANSLWMVKMDPSQVDQILANLCVNARDAIAGVGTLVIETGNAIFDEAYCESHPNVHPGDYVMFAVSDDGQGMSGETMAQIFEPFFTTKGVGEGTGLGLATVYGIVKQNNGFINVYSEPGQGTSFKIYLPRYAGEDQKSATSLPTIPLPGGNEVLLLVEDELAILNLVKRMLQKIGYRVLIAKNAREAVELAEEFSGDIDLLITDVVMPEMNGRDLSYRLQEIQPELKTLFMSGYTANIIAHHGIVDERVNFIQKPFSMEDLAGKVRKALVRED